MAYQGSHKDFWYAGELPVFCFLKLYIVSLFVNGMAIYSEDLTGTSAYALSKIGFGSLCMLNSV